MVHVSQNMVYFFEINVLRREHLKSIYPLIAQSSLLL